MVARGAGCRVPGVDDEIAVSLVERRKVAVAKEAHRLHAERRIESLAAEQAFRREGR